MIKLITTAIAAVSLLSACGHEEDISETKVIIGSNDLQYYGSDDKYSQAIGVMSLGCTATHIGNGIVLTAGHCVDDRTCEASKYDVTWNYRNNNKSGHFVSRCTKIIAKEFNDTRDYAILKYDETPDVYFKINKTDRPEAGNKLTILSHPEKAPLSWSGWCEHKGDYKSAQFRYDCDTKGGSSGAVVLNENLEVVGIHNLGSSYYSFNAGTYLDEIPAFQN